MQFATCEIFNCYGIARTGWEIIAYYKSNKFRLPHHSKFTTLANTAEKLLTEHFFLAPYLFFIYADNQ